MPLILPYGLIGRAGESTQLGYVALTPTDLTSEKGYGGALEYSPGSDSLDSANVTEILNSNQGSIHAWVKPMFASVDAHTHYICDFGNVDLYWDGANTQWKATVNGVDITRSDTFSAATWIYLLLTWEEDTPTLDLTADATSAAQVTSAQTIAAPGSTLYLGQDSSGDNLFNAPISMRLSNIIESSFYNSGDGDTDMYAVGPGSVVFNFTDEDTGMHYASPGKSGTTTTSTFTTDVGVIGKDNDEIVIYDESGFAVSGNIDGTPSGTSIPHDDGAGSPITNVEKVGVTCDFAGIYRTTGGDFLNVAANDFCISAYIKTTSAASSQVICDKGDTVVANI
ncbi:MAG: hypothetical protein ACW99U_18305, partial [Candidatus Thorarchaeota archaeon]